MDVNIRGGPQGFVRVTENAKQIVWPDYSGNRIYQSLGKTIKPFFAASNHIK